MCLGFRFWCAVSMIDAEAPEEGREGSGGRRRGGRKGGKKTRRGGGREKEGEKEKVRE